MSRVRSAMEEAKRVWSAFRRGDTCSLEANLNNLLRDLGLRLAYGQSDNRCCWIERVPCTDCETVLWYSCELKKFFWDRDEIPHGGVCEVRIVADVQYMRNHGLCEDAPPDAICVTGCNSSTDCVLEDALYAYRGSSCDCPNDPELNRILNLFQYNKKIKYECVCQPAIPRG